MHLEFERDNPNREAKIKATKKKYTSPSINGGRWIDAQLEMIVVTPYRSL
jgi:hypothetical protein